MNRHPSSSAVGIALVATLAVVLAGCSDDGGRDGEPGTGPSDANGEGNPADGPPGTGGGVVGGTPPDAGAANGAGRSLDQAAIARRVFDPAVARFAVHAFHEAGAEPYTGALGLSANDTWDITAESYRELFAAHRGRALSVPSRLERMAEFPDRGVTDWSIGELVALGDSLAPPLVDGDEVNVSIVFVRGLYDGNPNVLGIHPTNSPFAFVFKDVVESVGGDARTQRYVEQATVVHEIGHAIGLVANGVPMANPHEDADHPHHTTDRDGVMYWAVESPGGALDFLTDVLLGSRLQLFGSASLLDAQNYLPTD